MKHIKIFDTVEHLNQFKLSQNYIKPNVSLCEDNPTTVYYDPYVAPVVPITPQHDYVEIAGIKWATMNLGANSVTDAGLYFQWGDTEGYTKQQASNLTLSDYKYYDNESYTKYNNTDELFTLLPEDDAVTAAWGGNWRMPDISELQALDEAVNKTWTTNYQGSGMPGLICTDKTDNTKVLFFPAPNNINDSNYDAGVWSNYNNFGYYWSSSTPGNSAWQSGNVIIVRDNDMDTNSLNTSRYCGCLIRGINRPNYVEIAGIKWATMNVGANSVTDTGLYFQWGDIQGYTTDQVGSGEGKKYFSENDCIYYNDGSYTKYNEVDGKITLESTDDAVNANWGGNWRMPTVSEFIALGEAVNTAWTADYQGSGVAGLICTDKTDSSKVLFFPACGNVENGSVKYMGSFGYYWSSSLYADYGDSNVFLFQFYSGNTVWKDYGYGRYQGYPVRGIFDDSNS